MRAKIPNTRAPRQTSATRNGRPNAISTDPTRRCNANPTELILGNTLNASTQSFCTQLNDNVNCVFFFSKSIFTLNTVVDLNSCFCYSKEGKRIFGSDWNTKEKRDKMKCRTYFSSSFLKIIPAKGIIETGRHECWRSVSPPYKH